MTRSWNLSMLSWESHGISSAMRKGNHAPTLFWWYISYLKTNSGRLFQGKNQVEAEEAATSSVFFCFVCFVLFLVLGVFLFSFLFSFLLLLFFLFCFGFFLVEWWFNRVQFEFTVVWSMPLYPPSRILPPLFFRSGYSPD